MNPADEARNFLEELGQNKLPIVPREICRQLKIEYGEYPFHGFEGTIQLFQDGRVFVGINTNIREAGRKNFTCAHELGHYCMDLFELGSVACRNTEIESFGRSTKPTELRANQFASELLFPRHLLPSDLKTTDPDWKAIRKLAGPSSPYPGSLASPNRPCSASA